MDLHCQEDRTLYCNYHDENTVGSTSPSLGRSVIGRSVCSTPLACFPILWSPEVEKLNKTAIFFPVALRTWVLYVDKWCSYKTQKTENSRGDVPVALAVSRLKFDCGDPHNLYSSAQQPVLGYWGIVMSSFWWLNRSSVRCLYRSKSCFSSFCVW